MLLDDVRPACERVAAAARHVAIDDEAISRLAASLGPVRPPHPPRDGPAEEIAGRVLLSAATNFGSGWHPVLRKRPGRSGAVSTQAALAEWIDAEGLPRPALLTDLDAGDAAAILGQEPGGPAAGFLDAWAAALREVGDWVAAHGSYLAAVSAGAGSAAALVEAVGALPGWHDVADHDGAPVPLLKRAQLLVADLHSAFGGRGPGRFDDVDRLTMFADNLVPHVLRMHGCLVYTDALAESIDAGDLLAYGSAEEVEIRACGVEAVERLAAARRDLGHDDPPRLLDHHLWWAGRDPAIKAVPRHRTRCRFY